MFFKLFKNIKKSEYESLFLQTCSHCWSQEDTLHSCDDCGKKTICKKCYDKEILLCHECNSEYEQWQIALENVANKIKSKKEKKLRVKSIHDRHLVYKNKKINFQLL